MTDDAVQAGVDHPLPLLHPDRPGKVFVFPQDLPVQGIGQQKNGRRTQGDPGGQEKPAEAEAKSGGQKSGQKHQSAEKDHRFLIPLLFFRIQPFPQQVRILPHHDQPCEEHGDEQDPHEEPTLPVRKRPCGQEQQRAYQQNAEQKLDYRPGKQFSIHMYAFLRLPPQALYLP